MLRLIQQNRTSQKSVTISKINFIWIWGRCIVNHSLGMNEIILESQTPKDEFSGRLQIGQYWDWIHMIRIGENHYRHTSSFIMDHINEDELLVHVFKGNLGDVRWNLRECLKQQDDVVADVFSVHQTGPMEMYLHWLIDDLQSGVDHVEVGIGKG